MIQPELPLEKKIKIYTAMLSQTGTGDPIAMIEHNTFEGIPSIARIGTGIYQVTLADEFTIDKTTGFIYSQVYNKHLSLELSAPNTITISQTDSATGAAVDGIASKTFVEIRVYK